MDNQKFAYPPLKRRLRQIRRLLILPGSGQDELRCKLDVISLDEQPQYESLSYVWGKVSVQELRSITLNEQNFHVTKTLETALRRLRRLNSARSLWVDAVCINQHNIDERGEQVALMRDIFTNSERVLIWLGDSHSASATLVPTGDGSDPILDMYAWDSGGDDLSIVAQFIRGFNTYVSAPFAIRHQFEQNYTLGCFCLIHLLSQDYHICDIPFLKEPLFRRNILAVLSNIMYHEWWSRIWVVQEVVHAKEAELFYDKFICPWAMLVSAASSLNTHGTSCCRWTVGEFPTEDMKALRQFHTGVMDLEIVRQCHPNGFYGGASNSSLGLVLRQFRSRQSEDPRDKIYALLSLVSYNVREQGIIPDYSWTVEELYRSVVRHLITNEGNLSVLMGTMEKSPQLSHLPSWIPDWTTMPAKFEMDRLQKLNCHADYRGGSSLYGKKEAPRVRFLGEHILEAEGLIVDTVHMLADEMPSSEDDSQSSLEIFRSWFKLAGLPQNSNQPYVGGGSKGHAYWRTLSNTTMSPDGNEDATLLTGIISTKGYTPSYYDTFGYYGFLSISDYESIWDRLERAWLQQVSDNKDAKAGDDAKWLLIAQNLVMDRAMNAGQSFPNKSMTPSAMNMGVNDAIKYSTTNRRFFITQRGYMGLGPPTMRYNDSVCLLISGQSFPFVIRPAGDCDVGAPEVRPCHELIGDCYVSGLMEGETFQIPGIKNLIYLGPSGRNGNALVIGVDSVSSEQTESAPNGKSRAKL